MDTIYYAIRDISSGVFVLISIPMLINCFFGYKIQKFLITLGGIGVGALLGALLGLLSGETAVAVIAALILAILGGFLAFKLYKFGIFMQFWLLGTLVFAALFVVMGTFDLIVFAVVIGLVIGILALVLHKGFVIITTAVSGGMVAGVCIGMALYEPVVGIVIGIVLSVFGAIVQFSMEKKKTSSKIKANGVTQVQITVNQSMESQNVVSQPAETQNTVNQSMELKNTAGRSAESRISSQISHAVTTLAKNWSYTELAKIAPEYYCPESRLLIDCITLFKDNDGSTYFYLDFNNIGDSTLIAIYFKVKGYDVAGTKLGEQEYSFIDLNIAPGTKFKLDDIKLFDSNIRRLEVSLTQIVNNAYDVMKFDDSSTIAIPELVSISECINEEIAELVQLEADEKYLYTPLDNGLWVCTCGHIGYHKCSHCGRIAELSLKNTDEDIVKRIADNVGELLDGIDGCNTIREFDEEKLKIERVEELLEKNAISEELSNLCKSALDKIELRKNEIQSKKMKTKGKIKKIILRVLICTIVFVLLGVAAKIITELPPSDKKIKADMEMYIERDLEGKYTIHDFEINKSKLYEGYSFTIDAELKEEESEDKLKVTLNLDYFGKKYGRYVNTYGTTRVNTILPNHRITEKDEFNIPALWLICDNDRTCINQSNIKSLTNDGSIDLTYDIKYSDIVVTDNIAEVPIALHVEYLNSYADAEVTVSYNYCGNYRWESSEDIEVQLTPKGSLLDRTLIEQSIAGSSMDYKAAIVPEDKVLSCKYVTLKEYTVNYSNGFTVAELYGDFTWDNTLYKFTGTLYAMFQYVDGTWTLTVINCYDTSKPVRKAKITDDELLGMLTYKVSEISRKTVVEEDLYSVSLLKRENNSNGIKATVEYNSVDENYLYKNSMTIVLTESLTQNYVFSDPKIVNTPYRLIKAKSETITVGYRLSCDNATPVGTPSAGNASLNLFVDNAGSIYINGYIGNIDLSLTGKWDFPGTVIHTEQSKQSVYVTYSFLLTVSSDLEFYVTPNLRYDNGRITGTISYKSVGIGAGNFDIILE